MDLCYFFTPGYDKWITASLVSKELNLSIQTVTNSLKELEAHGILYSKKEGRERKYFLQDPDNFSKAFYQSIQLMQSNRMKGRYFPLQILLDELGRELRRLSIKDSQELEVLQDARLSDQLLDLVCQFQIIRHSTVINSVIIHQIDSEEAIVSLLGTILMIAEELIKGTLTIVLLIDPSRITYEKYDDLLPKRIRFIFGSLTKESPKKVSVVEKFGTETSLLIPGYAKKLAGEIWGLRFGETGTKSIET